MGKRHSRRGQFLQRVNASDQLSIQRLLTKSIHLACIDAPSIAIPQVPRARKRKIKPLRSSPNRGFYAFSSRSRLCAAPYKRKGFRDRGGFGRLSRYFFGSQTHPWPSAFT